jgi:alpha-L-rhamnosidase
VGEWLYRYVAGIDTDPHHPGYQHILIHPYPGGGLTYARAEYQSIRGRIASLWRVGPEGFQLDVSIPTNTQATVFVPATASTVVTASGKPTEGLSQRHELVEGELIEGVRFLRQEEDVRVFAIGSGDYHFVAVDQSAHDLDSLLP